MGSLARAARARGIPLLTFSSDLVFSGDTDRPYVESDLPAPLGRYGATGVPETMFIDRRGRLVGDIIAQAIDTNDDTDLLEDNIHRALRS